MFHAIADAQLEPVLTDLLYYFERDGARNVGLGVLTLPSVLEQITERDALALWWFQTEMQHDRQWHDPAPRVRRPRHRSERDER